ncbi:NAD(P)H-hydrate epimerase [Bosea sp. ASV33]|uniref:NAD(P)H-hydrate epimerase n=1 Tax=Bosea sp. ASV33 TaxID=2795106 RepID=UPI0018EAD776|nr:NAD(P)H-hydrate epimerase [Bosea sp. ASV33]
MNSALLDARWMGEAGLSGIMMMDNAGASVARETIARWAPCPVAALYGSGNSGGDGFVAAIAVDALGGTGLCPAIPDP